MPSTLFELAKRNGISLPSDDPSYQSEEALLERYKRFSSLDDFLAYYYRGMSVLVTERDFEDITYDYLKRAHRDGVMHAEIFFDPQAHLERVSFPTVIEGINSGRRRAEKDFGISTLLIMCFLRHLGQKPALELFHSDQVQKYLRSGTIAGIGLDSSEVGYPPELFRQVYEQASSLGLRVTAHAGEEGPVVNIQKSLHDLKCQRIDHGIRLIDDPELMRSVASSTTLLTLCPLSNVYLKCIEHVEQSPVRKFLDAGVVFSINSDDPAYLGGFILDNYCAVQDAFGLDTDDWKRICRNSIEASWCTQQRKEEMQSQLLKVASTRD